MALSWFAEDIDFTNVGVGRGEVQAHAAAWPQMHVARLQQSAQFWGQIAGGYGYALRFGIGLVQFHVARIQYFLNRIDG